MKIPCKYISVWDDGIEVESSAVYDTEARIVTNIEVVEESYVNDLDNCEREYIVLNGEEYDVFLNEDGDYVLDKKKLNLPPIDFTRSDYLELYSCENNTFICQIIEIFEGFLEDRGIVLDNDEKYEDDDSANIYGTDYGELQTCLFDLLTRYKVVVREEK